MKAKKTVTSSSTPSKVTQTDVKAKAPANRYYVFAANCTNQFGTFKKGDKARGAFPEALVQSYLKVGILKEVVSG